MYLTFLIYMSQNDFYELFIFLRGGMRKAAVGSAQGFTLSVFMLSSVLELFVTSMDTSDTRDRHLGRNGSGGVKEELVSSIRNKSPPSDKSNYARVSFRKLQLHEVKGI